MWYLLVLVRFSVLSTNLYLSTQYYFFVKDIKKFLTANTTVELKFSGCLILFKGQTKLKFVSEIARNLIHVD